MSKQLRIIYAGTPEFSVAALQALIDNGYNVIAVYTQPDRPAGRGRELKASPVKACAVENNIPVYQPVSLKEPEVQQQMAALKADLMVVTAYGLILPQAVLQVPRLGCINIHASLLPRWRGAAPIQRAILAGDQQTGVTIMQMDEGLDTGNMLVSASCDITDEVTGSSLHDRLMLLGAKTLLSVLPAIADETVEPVVQKEANACYAEKLSKAEAQINWTLPATEIFRAIQAYNSWPVAHSFYQKSNKKMTLRIWQGDVIAGSPTAQAGAVVAESSAGIDVATGEGVLRITELQPEGKRRMSVADFLNANSLSDQVLG